MYKYLKTYRQRRKQLLVQAFGGKCQKCGYSKTYNALDFHHIDKSEKKYTISNLLRNPKNLSTIIEEIKKCVLLCKNCHCELHAEIWNISELNIITHNLDLLYKQTIEYIKICKSCKKEFVTKLTKQLYCSSKCYNKEGKISNKPTREELLDLIWKYPMTKIGKMYNTSDKTIKAWIKKYNLQQPNRGYFLKKIK